MSAAPGGLVAGLPEWLQAAQETLLRGLDALGLVPQLDGQPAWPWARRLAVETLAIDAALSRQLLWAAASLALALVLLLMAWRWRRGRWPALAAVAGLAFVTPWPAPELWLQPALPTSFHQSTPALPVARLSEGLRLYQQHCAQCHGADGRGETARAAELPVWPPRLSGALLWRRAEGETYWHVRKGMRDARGDETMPGFGARLTPEQTWSVLGALRVMASGRSLKEQGRWSYPVAAPDLRVRCGADAPPRRLSDWRGTRLRLVLVAGAGEVPREDPRFETVLLGDAPPPSQAAGCFVAAEENEANEARALIALLSGGSADASGQPGLQLLVDRDGWLRALGRPGQGGWRAEDLVCRSGSSGPLAVDGEGGLDTLIRTMDADPVRRGRVLRHSAGSS